MPSTYIAIQDSHNHYDDFVNFMNATTDALKSDSFNKRSYYLTRKGEKLEDDVLLFMKAKASDFHFNPDNISKTPKQHFPDIIANNYYGVEVKTTKDNSWQSIGSSIVESLRSEDIQKVFLMFGILNKDNVDFRCKPYEECLSEISITHSPRYQINMDMKENSKTIFDKMGIPYDEFRTLGDEKIGFVRNYYREKYKNQKRSMPWWIETNSFDYELPETLKLHDGLRLYSEVSNDEKAKRYLYKCFYMLFPEILGKDSSTKYQKLTLWLCSRHSLVCGNVRDSFSAGGKGDIYVDGKLKWSGVPKYICNILPYISCIKKEFQTDSPILTEIELYSNYYTHKHSHLESWIRECNYHISNSMSGKEPIKMEDLLTCRFEKKSSNAFYLVSEPHPQECPPKAKIKHSILINPGSPINLDIHVHGDLHVDNGDVNIENYNE